MILYYTYITSYTIFSLYCYYIDVLSNPIKAEKDKKIIKYKDSIKIVSFNIFITTYIAFYLAYSIYEPRKFNILLSVRDLIVSRICSGFLFYWAHRLFHTVKILQKYHRVHHEFSYPIGMRAAYSHPIDYFFGNLIPFGTVPFLLNTDEYTMVLMIIYGVYITILQEHSNYKPISSHHFKHHLYYNCNYGMVVLDKLFNTYRE
jgi:hypothetical protein